MPQPYSYSVPLAPVDCLKIPAQYVQYFEGGDYEEELEGRDPLTMCEVDLYQDEATTTSVDDTEEMVDDQQQQPVSPM